MSELTEKISDHETIYIYFKLQTLEQPQWTGTSIICSVKSSKHNSHLSNCSRHDWFLGTHSTSPRYLGPHLPKPFFLIRAGRLSLRRTVWQNHPLSVLLATYSLNQQLPACSHHSVVSHKVKSVDDCWKLSTPYICVVTQMAVSWLHRFENQ